jgi:hypothetical protein
MSTTLPRPLPIMASLVALALLSACGDESSSTPAPATDAGTTDGSTDPTADVGSPDATDALSTDGSSDTSETDATAPPLRSGPTTNVFVTQQFIFEREEPASVSRGFDLDGATSAGNDATGCGQQDFASPDGTGGIDNQFALLLPIIEAAGGSALPSLVQAAINEGDLLIVVTVNGMDDPVNDDDVELVIGRAIGTTLLGSNRFILPWQTFDLDTNEAITSIPGGVLQDGIVTAGVAALDLPIFVFGFRFDITLHNAQVRGVMSGNQLTEVLVGGAVTLENVLEIARGAPGIQDRIPELIQSVGATLTDSTVVSSCDAFSVSATMYTIPAFLFDTPSANGE